MHTHHQFPEPNLIPVNGVELEVFEAGQENAGSPVGLCHGWPEHAFAWRHQVPALVADEVLDQNTQQVLRNLLRKNVPPAEPKPGNVMITLAEADAAAGDRLMSDSELAVFVRAFERSGFRPSINWYRNLDRNWHLLSEVDAVGRAKELAGTKGSTRTIELS